MMSPLSAKVTVNNNTTKQPSLNGSYFGSFTPIFSQYSSRHDDIRYKIEHATRYIKKCKFQKNAERGMSLWSSPFSKAKAAVTLRKTVMHPKAVIPRKTVEASMTVEAAMVLPLFLLCILSLLSFIEILRLHGNIEIGLREACTEMAYYSYALTPLEAPSESIEQKTNPLLQSMTNLSISYLYVGNQLKSILSEKYLENSPLLHGIKSLEYTRSSFLKEDSMINAVVTYEVAPLSGVLVPFQFRMANRCYIRAWTGYDVEHLTKEDMYVYVTLYGSSFHWNRDCTHLKLSIESVLASNLFLQRNLYGEKYEPCEYCHKDNCSLYYIAEQGECYHAKADCQGLKRTILLLPYNEAVEKYSECSRCNTN